MGMFIPDPDRLQRTDYKLMNWSSEADADRVSISLSADCLRRLLEQQQLHVEDVSCLDRATKAKIRQMLLSLIH
ncbi:hypothetical protein HLV39_11450 [Marinobacter adhaerens]|uniref:Uncharacterized protein n=1 Tax=Marinobacter adhaerens TaxID=1033846 RepID=A0A851I1W5_9GAMM|nr:hypothetical protein [Marinobacter adhaerens]NWN92108.1 hypothetical protein [Marinobacter adhaerens]